MNWLELTIEIVAAVMLIIFTVGCTYLLLTQQRVEVVADAVPYVCGKVGPLTIWC